MQQITAAFRKEINRYILQDKKNLKRCSSGFFMHHLSCIAALYLPDYILPKNPIFVQNFNFMRKITFLLSLLVLITSCGVKQTENLLHSGDYNAAIDNAVYGLRTNKDKKGKQEYVYLLEEAFAKAKERDLRQIDLYIKDANPSNLEKVFNLYQQLNSRQEQIRPLLPLKLLKENRQAQFVFEDYSEQIVNSKNALSKYLYTNTRGLLGTPDKMNYRRAYDDLLYLDQINPNYKDVRKLIEDAHAKGSDYVTVYTQNDTRMIIPVNLEKDLLDFSTYGLNDKWTVYHNSKQKGINYDYSIMLNFRQITISPEQVKEKEISKETQVKAGTKKLLDSRGRVVKDSLGNVVMVDNIKTVRATVYESSQFKSSQVVAKVDYTDLKTKQLIQSFPLASEFIFENTYATYRGDKRAVNADYYPYFNRKAVPFPSNEQMVYDTAEDLKAKLKTIITNNKLRRQ